MYPDPMFPDPEYRGVNPNDSMPSIPRPVPGDLYDQTFCDKLMQSPDSPPMNQMLFCVCSHCKGQFGTKGDRGDRGLPGMYVINVLHVPTRVCIHVLYSYSTCGNMT